MSSSATKSWAQCVADDKREHAAEDDAWFAFVQAENAKCKQEEAEKAARREARKAAKLLARDKT